MTAICSRFRLIFLSVALTAGVLGLAPNALASTSSVGCSVSELINAVNAAGNGDILNLASNCTYTLTTAYGATTTGLPAISTNLTLNGSNTIIERSSAGGTPQFRLLQVDGSGSLTLNSLTLRNGSVTDIGGGILNNGTLTLNTSTMSGSSANNAGGAIYSVGLLTITASTINGNTAVNDGGSIWNSGTTMLLNSTISSNTVTKPLTSRAGGIFSTGTLDLSFSTIAFNTGAVAGNVYSSGVSNVQNNLILNNPSDSGSTFNSGFMGGNIDGENTGIVLPLTNNGGSTETHALTDSSIARDFITPANCTDVFGNPVTTDQRGVTRPIATGCDSGAYEAACPGFPAAIVTSGDLIQAINAANCDPADNTLDLEANTTYTLTAVNNTTDGNNGLPVILDATTRGKLTINGNGAIIERSSASGTPDFTILQVASGGNLTLGNVTIRHGRWIEGGGIYNNQGALTLTGSTLEDNVATGDIPITAGQGGGIYNRGTLKVSGTTFLNNMGDNGGGIFNRTTLTVINSTFSGNVVTNLGGGVYNTAVGVARLTNDTFSNNGAPNGGGGVGTSGTMVVNNTIISHSTSGGDCNGYGSLVFNNSLVEDGTCNVVSDVNGNRTGDPSLGALTDSPAYFPLNVTSLAINAGDNTLAVDVDGLTPIPYDERGVGFARIYGIVDMGAYEATFTPDFVVDTTSDLFRAGCTSAAANDCSLRGAITLANALAGTDTITFDASVFNPGTITLAGGLPDISANLNITGLGADQVIVDGASLYRPFNIPKGVTVSLSGLTITRGDSGIAGDGGAVKNAGALTIGQATFSSNHAVDGGGLYNSGTATVTQSQFTGNSADTTGGGLENTGVLTLIDSTIANNTAVGGGGLDNAGNLTIQRSTVSSNTATSEGGAIDNYNGSLTIADSAIVSNTSDNGGGIMNVGGMLTISNSTIAANTASSLGGGLGSSFGSVVPPSLVTVTVTNSTIASNTAAYGGGIYNQATTLNLGTTIVAGNSADPIDPDIDGTVNSFGYNLIGNTTGATISGTTTGNLTDAAAQPLNLGALANNGGSTPTMALLDGSVAINAGDPTFNAPIDYDQRGAGFPRVLGGRIDTGAYESSFTTDFIQNGDFSGGLASWSTYGGEVHQLDNGVFEFYGTSSNPQGVVFQDTGLSVSADTPLEASVQLGNSSNVRKRALLILGDVSFSDLQVCNFWIPPNTPLHTYTMQTFTTQAWSSAMLSVYAASNDSTGWYLVDNASLVEKPSLNVTTTKCFDPLAPSAPGGADGSNLVVNSDFSADMANWGTYGQITYQLTNHVFEFYGATGGLPRAVVLQYTNTALPTDTILEASVDLGNSSGLRKRALLLISDYDFTDMQVCSFWIPPNTPPHTYTIRTYASDPWDNATFSVYAAKGDDTQWLQVDNASLLTRPSVSISGAECYYPGASLPIAPLTAVSANFTVVPTTAPVFEPPPAMDVLPNQPSGAAVPTSTVPTHEPPPLDSGLNAPPPGG